jgi:hypothetical protein
VSGRTEIGVVGGKFVDAALLLLPWIWIAAAVWVLLRPAKRAAHPQAVKAFAIVLVLMGVSNFFVMPAGTLPWWLIAWKAACAAAAVSILLYLRAAAGRKGRAEG